MTNEEINDLIQCSSISDRESGLPLHGIFVTGSDTGIGKTQVSLSIIAALQQKSHRVGAFKPVASGSSGSTTGQSTTELDDVTLLWQAIQKRTLRQMVCTRELHLPLAPPLAAEREGDSNIDEKQFIQGAQNWKQHCDFLLVEGAGGLLSPLTWNWTNANLAKMLGYPLIVVVANRLGAANQCLLACQAAISQGLAVHRVVLNDVTSSHDEVRRYHDHVRLIHAVWEQTIRVPIPKILHHPFLQPLEPS